MSPNEGGGIRRQRRYSAKGQNLVFVPPHGPCGVGSGEGRLLEIVDCRYTVEVQVTTVLVN